MALAGGKLDILSPISVAKLLEAFDANEPWTLHLAQRSAEWDEQRIANLVDSMLRGFPIGTLLLVESDGASYELGDPAAGRRASKRPGWQLLDGQQRCLAVRATFGGHGLDGASTRHLWVNLVEHNPRRREFDARRSQAYVFAWSTLANLNRADAADKRREKVPVRPERGWIRFSVLVDSVRAGKAPSAVARAAALKSGEDHIASELIAAARAALQDESIPVHRLRRGLGVEDLHEVFIRLNAGGVPLSAADQFFAGVKRHWESAEEDLAKITSQRSAYHRAGGIRVLARCAGVRLEERPLDLHRLRLADLASRDRELVSMMRSLVPHARAPFPRAVHAVSAAARRKLGLGMRYIGGHYFDPIVAWAHELAIRGELPAVTSRLWRPALQFLFWASCVSAYAYGRGQLHRFTFRTARQAGVDGKGFPVDQMFREILEYDRARRRLPVAERFSFSGGDGRRAMVLMGENRVAFLAPFQGVADNVGPVDIDHVYPQALARKRTHKRGDLGGRIRDLLNQIGNLAVLDSSTNRAMQDRPPSVKLPELSGLGLRDDEVELLLEMERLLDARDMEASDVVVSDYVRGRSARIWRNAVATFGAPPRPPQS